MTKKQKEEVKEEFDLITELKAYPCPEFFKKAFLKTMDTSNIKSKKDLDKAIKTYGEMK